MSNLTTKAVAKVAAVATGLAMATSMLSLAPMAHAQTLTTDQVNAIISLLQSFGADATTVANVQAALTGTPTTTPPPTGGTTACVFTRDLTVGATGTDVTCLQTNLIAMGYSIPAGATGYFGSQTKAAVSAWQTQNAVSPAAGYFGSISRSKWPGLGIGGTPPPPPPPPPLSGTGLKVMLAATSPSGSVLVQGQAIGNLGEYTFTNPTSASVSVTGLTFNRIGVSNDSTLTNIYLYQGGTRLTDSVGISSGQFSFTNSAGLFTVPAGGTVTVAVRSDIAGSTSGQQVGVSLVSVSSTGTLDPSVSFPINSGYQTISAATLATVDYTNASATPTSAITVSAQNDYPIWQNSVSVSSNPVKLTSLRFTNLGSINAADVTNLRLYVDGTQVGSALAQMGADRSVVFDLSAAPVDLTTSSHVVKVLANILSSGASRTIQLSVQRASDGMFVDAQLNQPVTPTAAGSTFAAVNTGVITVQSASAGVSVSLNPASPTSNIAVGASNVKWASFDMLASGENVKVMDLHVYANTSAHSGGLDNGKIMVNGVQVGSTKDIGEDSGSATDFSLGSSLILPGGQTTTVDIYADAKTSTSTNLSNSETVTVSLKAGSSNAQGVSSLTAVNLPSAAVDGNTITVSSSSLTATKYTGYGNQTMVAGSNSAKVGSFTLSTGSTEGVAVNTIDIDFASAVASTLTNLTLKDSATGTILGAVIATPGTANSFAVTLDVPVSSTKTIDIYANILSSANAGTFSAVVDTGTTGTGLSTNQTASVAADVTLQTITIGSGTLSITQGAGDPVSDNVLAGAAEVKVGQFQFTGSNSSYTVQNLAVLVPNGAATSVTNVTLKYTDVNGTAQTATQAITTSATAPYATATFTGLTMYVPMNDSANLDVYVGTPTIASGATSGAAITVTLDTGATSGTFRAINSAGSATTQINSGTNVASNGTHYVRKSIPTFTVTTTATQNAIASPLYSFTVTADAAGAIEWSKLVFTIATTSATLTSVYLTDSNGTNLLDNTTSSASTTATAVTVNLEQNRTQPKFQQVAAGETKTYHLYGTVAGFTTGSTLTIKLAQDTGTPNANDNAADVTGNVVWSDRSATSHSITTTDWTNGVLLKNFTTTQVSYSK